jgi:hypothetical protein
MQRGLEMTVMLAGILALFSGPAMLSAMDTSVSFIHADQVHSLRGGKGDILGGKGGHSGFPVK